MMCDGFGTQVLNRTTSHAGKERRIGEPAAAVGSRRRRGGVAFAIGERWPLRRRSPPPPRERSQNVEFEMRQGVIGADLQASVIRRLLNQRLTNFSPKPPFNTALLGCRKRYRSFMRCGTRQFRIESSICKDFDEMKQSPAASQPGQQPRCAVC